eukprot:TRINITY_DN66086_c0_g1_i1.p1 TRINITY_DN66086_c0_g1~~TRINITY_DN66086_c0_g1_i1.p1  ORF type:complete len:412 (-),score=29.14 TRINITY_DN66086_c0_g1_i1:107-1342(-)
MQSDSRGLESAERPFLASSPASASQGRGSLSSMSVHSEVPLNSRFGGSPSRRGEASVDTNAAMNDFRIQVARFVEQPQSSVAATAFQAGVIITTLVSVSAVIIETVPEFRKETPIFFWLEVIATVVFTFELVLRFIGSVSALMFFMSPFTIVDIISVLPGYVELLCPQTSDGKATTAIMSLRVLRLMWLVRILRLAKVARHSSMLSAVVSVLGKVWSSSILIICGVLAFFTVVSASLLYMAESDRCEELGISCEGFDSIPAAFWFSIQTLTTCGYGDTIPVTPTGKLLAGFLCVCAVIMLALTGALLSFDFAEHLSEESLHRQKQAGKWLHLGKDGEDLQELVSEFTDSWDKLMARLDSAAVHQTEAPRKAAHRNLTLIPMLRLIQDKGRVVCSEANGVVNALGALAVRKT